MDDKSTVSIRRIQLGPAEGDLVSIASGLERAERVVLEGVDDLKEGGRVQIIGEGGRLSDIEPPLLDLLDFTSVSLRVSAWYAQGGVRLIASPNLAVRPYTEATAGLARLHTRLSGFGGQTDAVIDAALAFLNRTEPMLGLGGGIVVGGRRVALDVGYRYKRILANGVASAVNGGDAYQVNEARVGVGFRF